MDSIVFNDWRKLDWYDPEPVLRNLRELEHTVSPLVTDPKVRELRTHGLKSKREARDAAIFTYGIGQAVVGAEVFLAPVEASDYDFVTTWQLDDTWNYCPVQLKELVQEELNPNATLDGLIKSLRRKYVASERTAVAVKLNRRQWFDFAPVHRDGLGIRELWFYGATTPDQNKWCLFGDALETPGFYEFSYPQSKGGEAT